MLKKEWVLFMETQFVINLDALKEHRREKRYSISDLAIHLGYKTPTGYWLIENGQRKVSIDTLYRLAQLYCCTMESLVTKNKATFRAAEEALEDKKD